MKTYHFKAVTPDVDRQEFFELLAFSLRYSLTRYTYAPATVLEVLERNMEYLGHTNLTKLRDVIVEDFLEHYPKMNNDILKETRKRCEATVELINERLGDMNE